MCTQNKQNWNILKLSKNKTLFARFILRHTSRKEDAEVLQSEESKEMLKKGWNSADSKKGEIPAPDSKRVYYSLQSSIDPGTQQVHNQAPIITFFKRWYVAAGMAAVISGLAVFFFTSYFYSAPSEIVHQRTGKGQRLRIELPDGSYAWMNGHSTLSYPVDMRKTNKREVILEGEAFFSVMSSSEKPFIVQTSDMNVQATGTRFNVTNYPEDDYAETHLLEGEVQVFNPEAESAEPAASLIKDMKVRLDKNKGTMETMPVDAETYTAWRHGALIFNNDPLQEVARRLEHWYGIEFIIHEDLIGKNRYTFQLQNDSISDVLKWLKKITPMEIRGDRNRLFLEPEKEDMNEYKN